MLRRIENLLSTFLTYNNFNPGDGSLRLAVDGCDSGDPPFFRQDPAILVGTYNLWPLGFPVDGLRGIAGFYKTDLQFHSVSDV